MLNNFIQNILPQAVSGVTPLAFVLVYIGGIITSLSPCILTMIPIMVGYIGGFGDEGKTSKAKGLLLSIMFVLGMSVTFAIFGLIAVVLGKIVGQVGSSWYYVLATIAMVMGLQLLGVINIKFPSGIGAMPIKRKGLLSAFLMGLIFGFVMSPCATPVLAVIVTYVATTGSFLYGAGLLFVYGLGHGLPLIIVGTFTSTIKGLPRFQKYSHYLTKVSGGILILLGLYFLILVRW